jgi:uncharacterized protein YjaZ
MFDQLMTALMPVLTDALSIIVMALIAFAAQRFARWTGVQIEEKHMRTLHSAIMTGIREALAKGMDGKSAVAHAVSWAQTTGAPDAIKALRVNQNDVQYLASAKLQELTNKGP